MLGAVLAALLVLLSSAASFFFSLAETALFSLSKWQVRQLAERSPKNGSIVQRLLAEPQDLLAAMVLGNTFALAGMLGISLWMITYGLWPFGITITILFLLTLVGGEVLPKTMAVRNAEAWALRIAKPLLLAERISAPLRKVAQQMNGFLLRRYVPKNIQPQAALTDADYQELLEMAFQQGTLGLSEKEIILQIISLDRRTAREVMKPRAQMGAISDDLSFEEMIHAAKKLRHRRIPIYDETPDTIVGVLNTRVLLLEPQVDLADAIEFPSFVPESMNLLQLMKSLQRQQRGLAIVLDEFGGTAGIVTLEDIMEEIVGGVRREAEQERLLIERIGPGKWRVTGSLRIDDFRREYAAIGDVAEVETMGGLLVSLLEVVPSPGQSAVFRGLRLTAQITDERRVRELFVEAIK